MWNEASEATHVRAGKKKNSSADALSAKTPNAMKITREEPCLESSLQRNTTGSIHSRSRQHALPCSATPLFEYFSATPTARTGTRRGTLTESCRFRRPVCPCRALHLSRPTQREAQDLTGATAEGCARPFPVQMGSRAASRAEWGLSCGRRVRESACSRNISLP